MPSKKKAARRPTRAEINDLIATAEKIGDYNGYKRGVEDQVGVQHRRAEEAKAKAPRRNFSICQNENGFELTEYTAGSVRGKSWVADNASELGVIVDSLVA
jgi:hypothetical protein